MNKFINTYSTLLIMIFAALLYIPFLGSVRLFDWDEINFAENAREMLVTNNFLSLQMNYLPFWEKPPLFIWLSALSLKLFGVSEFAARFPNAVCGIITLLLLYKIGKKLYNERMAILWVICYAGSTLPLFYFKTGIIDPWFNLFIFLGIYYYVLFSYGLKTGQEKNRTFFIVLSAVFIGLAVLTKGPAAVIIYAAVLGIYMVRQRFKKVMSWPHFFIGASVLVLVGASWFLLLISDGKQHMIAQFISYQLHLFQTEDSGHGGSFFYHFIVLLFGCFPASIFAIKGLMKAKEEEGLQKQFRFFMLILFWFVLLLFSIVKTKIVHYSSLCYFPLSFLAALTLNDIIEGKLIWKRWMNVLLLIVGSIFALVLMALPLVDYFKDGIIQSGWIADEFTIENLKAEVHWSGFEPLIGLITLLSLFLVIKHVKKNELKQAILLLFGSNILVVLMTSMLLAPKIEQYSQAAAIEFYISKQKEECYVSALGYHSYAQYFYSLRKREEDPEKNSVSWMLHGKIDKPAYFVSKITNAEEHHQANTTLVEVGRKNGFVFFKREVEDEIRSEQN